MRIILSFLILASQVSSTWAATTWGEHVWEQPAVCASVQSLERRIEMLEIVIIAQQQQLTAMRKGQ